MNKAEFEAQYAKDNGLTAKEMSEVYAFPCECCGGKGWSMWRVDGFELVDLDDLMAAAATGQSLDMSKEMETRK